MSNTFGISDTHFKHQNIIRYCNRPWKTADQMDAALIINWNGIVKPEDEVWHLGDFVPFVKDIGLIRSYRERLNGKINLVMGNHDKCKVQEYEQVFDFVVPFNRTYDTFIDIWHQNIPIRLCHYPGFRDVLPVKRYDNHVLFGHIHDREHQFGPRYHNISVEQIGYTPIRLDEVL